MQRQVSCAYASRMGVRERDEKGCGWKGHLRFVPSLTRGSCMNSYSACVAYFCRSSLLVTICTMRNQTSSAT
eukprot:scaffold8329_cov277-Pinguiococcus_pyrenoidosus.AAC.6